MRCEDEQALAAINYVSEQDAQVREDIRRSLDYHDRAFFVQVVSCVMDRLQLPVSGELIESAYNWFRSRI